MRNQKEKNGRKVQGILTLLLSLTVLLGSLPVFASQTREILDIDRIGSFSITITYYNETSGKTLPVSNGNSVGLYKIADAVEDNGFRFVVDDRFSSVGEIPDTSEELDNANLELAEKLAAIAEKYDFDVAPKEMDTEGKVYFNDLEVGLYLIVQASQGKDENSKFTIYPFLMTIPYRNPDGSLNYDVDAEMKPVAVTKEEPTPTPTPKPPIPQTGQLWWPVMVLGAIGAIFVLSGIIRKNKN